MSNAVVAGSTATRIFFQRLFALSPPGSEASMVTAVCKGEEWQSVLNVVAAAAQQLEEQVGGLGLTLLDISVVFPSILLVN